MITVMVVVLVTVIKAVLVVVAVLHVEVAAITLVEPRVLEDVDQVVHRLVEVTDVPVDAAHHVNHLVELNVL